MPSPSGGKPQNEGDICSCLLSKKQVKSLLRDCPAYKGLHPLSVVQMSVSLTQYAPARNNGIRFVDFKVGFFLSFTFRLS
jgi:hypothetical protein